MPGPRTFDHATPQTALLTTRLVWATLLAGQAAFVLAAMSIWSKRLLPPTPPQVVRLMAYLAIASLVVLVPLGYHLRNQTYKKHWRGHAISPRGYISGNLLLFACCGVVTIVGLVAGLIGGAVLPWAAPALAAMAVYLVNFPTGRAMQPAPPRA